MVPGEKYNECITMNTTLTTKVATPGHRRLPSAVRIQQILDAAQIEFFERGFFNVTIDDIAARCGMSKGGLYAHFKSKEALFEALLARSLTPPDLQDMPKLSDSVSAAQLAEWLVNRLYQFMGNPQAIATFRLIIAESERTAHLLEQWQRTVLQPHLQKLGEMLRNRTLRSGRTDSVIVREPWLLLSPIVHMMVSQIIFGKLKLKSVDEFRTAHIALLSELLAG